MGYVWKPVVNSSATLAGAPGSRPLRARSKPTPEPAPAEEATLADVVEAFVAAADDGTARTRIGRRYRPSAVRDLAGCLRNHVVPELGDLRLLDVQPDDLQRLIDDLAAGELSLSRIRSVVSAIRGLYGYAIERGIVEVSPAAGLQIARFERTRDAEDDKDADTYSEVRWSPERDWTSMRREPSERGFPETVLSFVLRTIVVVFIIIVLASVAQSLLIPA